MGIFEEYLADWEWGDRWRPVGERLAALAERWPLPELPPDDYFTIWDGLGREDGSGLRGVLIWLDLPSSRKPGWVGVTLGAQIDDDGLRCGEMHGPAWWLGPAEFALAADDFSLEQLTDQAVAWFGRKREAWIAANSRPRSRWRRHDSLR